MMSTFSDYYNQKIKDYNYKIKIASCDFTDENKMCIEKALQKYDLKGKITYKKTPLQENPMDFPQLKNVEVHIADITTSYPASPEALRTYLSNESGINLACIAVYNKNDPRLQDQEDYLARKAPEFKDEYEPMLGKDYDKEDNSHLYGEKYNTKFLKDLEDARKERGNNTVINPLSPEQKIDGETVTGPEKGAQGKDTVLSRVDVQRYSPNKKVTLFSRNEE
jgi:hypothetical protein